MSNAGGALSGLVAHSEKRRWPIHMLASAVAVTLVVLVLHASEGSSAFSLPNISRGSSFSQLVKLSSSLEAAAQAPRPERWADSNIELLNEAPFCHIGGRSGGGRSKAGPGLQALVQQQQLVQEQFCQELAAGKPNPLGTPGNETYVRVAAVASVGDAAVTYPMWVHQGDDIVSTHIIAHGVWEQAETSSVLRLMNDWKLAHPVDSAGPVLVDIGGNLGWFSLQAAAMGYRVIAFEPMPRNHGAFRRTLCENPDLAARITLVPKGLGTKPGHCQVGVKKDNLGNGFPVCEGAAFTELSKQPDFIAAGEFEVTTLDDVLSGSIDELAGRVQVLKIDVEGFEPQVFGGASRFNAIVQPRHMLAELNQGYKSATSPQMLLSMYHNLGYTVHMYSFEGPVLLPKTYDSLAQTLFKPGTEHNIYLHRLPSCI